MRAGDYERIINYDWPNRIIENSQTICLQQVKGINIQ